MTPLEIKQKLLDGEMSWQEALNIITNPKQKPWHTKEWKERRKARLGKTCQKCGSVENLVIQHTWHPPSTKELFYLVRAKYRIELEDWKRDHPIGINTDKLVPSVNACPKCESTAIRYRKKADNWICNGRRNKAFCYNVFDKPILIISKGDVRELKRESAIERLRQFDEAYNIGFQVVLLSIDSHLRYISLEDTVTYCKRCAFVEDKRPGLKLCEVCGKNYHKIGYKTCYKCFQTTPRIDN